MSTPYQDPPQSTGYYAATPTPSAPSPHPQSTPEFTQPGPSTTQQSRPATGQDSEEARKDKTLAEFMLMLDDYEPLIPNEVTEYYLQRVGFECEDVRLKRLLSLAAQKFVSDIASDAYQHARIRANATGGRSRAQPSGTALAREKTKTTLTMDDLGAALADYGINMRKPEFYM
ncbi:transcription initiation factor IID, TAF10 subunit [Polyporus arcularius HHB13444]|uniref:Transcription initiation factor TFIID subunit 10 n=2 Tax=Polyporaceae TaxID=5317 RepID=A0A5C3PWK5_9APHY|nr:transcription initiation factor IID, TAF10 subunit [Polyporus brumalis]TFK94185.1 transcription initiation factor IID, TAF10 subunit [Polyporus arcularius HHB13444]